MTSVADVKVLVIDCQATHANPEKGSLLEMAWAVVRPSDPLGLDSVGVKSFLFGTAGKGIPSNVSRVTGITEEHLQEAIRPEDAWSLLEEDLNLIARKGQVTAIIHFARYEEPHLRYLSKTATGDESLPFHIVCTHEAVRRLFPQLPRKGLRAVAGYLGHSVPELRRSAPHVVATAFVWKRIVQRLQESHQVQTMKALREWLRIPPPKESRERFNPMAPSERLSLPDRPGVYRMLRSNGDLLYVGKASSLKKRVNSYFQKRSCQSEHILEMLTQARSLKVSISESALEAALLENDEIKRFSPPYNIALRLREKDLVFTSRDFRTISKEPDPLHPVGPLPKRVGALLNGIVSSTGSEALSAQLLSGEWFSREDVVPDRECLDLGWQMFQERHQKELTLPAAGLHLVGAQLWIQRRKAEEDNKKSVDNNSELESDLPQEDRWSPEQVCRRLESNILAATCWIRRVKWFSLLSESSLSWRTDVEQDNERILLVLQAGQVFLRKRTADQSSLPVPPGYRIPSMDRRKRFDLTIIDRLRVLTTEFKRLHNEDRDLRIRLSPTRTLAGDRIAGILSWV